jgi:hypothetical protein
MARLIDADVALKRFIQETEASGKNVIHISTIKRLLQDIETAYDVDKVVEEINNIDLQHPCDDCPHLQECDRIQTEVSNATDLCSLVTKHYAIEAVRKGGVK